ncbi:cation:proton antiporter [Legionella busanensis]|nr:cation:proton antiporter [Legionella busanensis]
MLNKIYFFCLLLMSPAIVFASDMEAHDPIANVILWVTLFFSFAILGRYFAKLLNQPGVLGELLMGVIIGNICYFFGSQLIVVLREGAVIYSIMKDLLIGNPLVQAVAQHVPNPFYAAQVTQALSSPAGIEFIKIGYVLDVFSRYGVIFLLFKVGLESSIQELKHTGIESIKVAVIGVVAPIILGFLVAYIIVPEASYKVNLFVAATLTATSIGITARVLSEMNKLKTREARTILGAAMLDDILGLIILAVVSSIVIQGHVDLFMIGQVIIATILFFMVAILLGPWLLNKSIKYFHFLDLWEEKLFISFIFVMFFAWLATVVKLAAIIGAFAAGLIINDSFFENKKNLRQHSLKINDLISPIESLLAPLFFMLIGLQVKLEAFMHWQVIIMASGLIAAAIIGKLLSGLGGSKKDDRMLIGIGMLPRGEVGLVFASIGRTLGVISDQLFSAIILMVIITTVIAPPWLKNRYAKQKGEALND